MFETLYSAAYKAWFVGLVEGTQFHAVAHPRKSHGEAQNLADEYNKDVAAGLIPKYEVSNSELLTFHFAKR